jgi:UDP-glucuronate 4-epimerase
LSRVLVTGAAGFIGFHLSQVLLARGDEVIGFDNVNDYYDVRLKHARLEQLNAKPGFTFLRGDLGDKAAVQAAFKEYQPERVVNLAAQAGVRYSITNPEVYIESNLVGFLNILECCRHNNVQHLVYASSSSVYGANEKLPFSVHDSVDHPVSLYAATKKANELMAHAYSHLYGLPTTGLRFFTVYGPWGRPDMALFIFVKAILSGKPIDVFNNGQMVRDFTYVDDIVEGVVRVLDRTPEPSPQLTADQIDPAVSRAPYRVYNIGNNSPVQLMEFIRAIEQALGMEANLNLLPMQPGDVPATQADVDDLIRDTGFAPATSVQDGISRFVKWYREYYGC